MLWLCVVVLIQSWVITQAKHTNNWAVLVSTSRYWYNYRHISNTLSFYRTVKRLGIPDSNIILMLAEDVACNPRNPYPATVFNHVNHKLDLYGEDVEVDYRGYEVTVENFVRVLTGRHDPAIPRAKRLLSNEGSNILIYLSGHGGNEFLKFQDTEELLAQDLADAVQQMYLKGRYYQILLLVDTCQAATLYQHITAPHVLAGSSSVKGESSYSAATDIDVGLSLMDRWSSATLDFLEGVDLHSSATLQDMFNIYDPQQLDSHFTYTTRNFPRPLNTVKITEFFGAVASVRTLSHEYKYLGGSNGTSNMDKQGGFCGDMPEGLGSPSSLCRSSEGLGEVVRQQGDNSGGGNSSPGIGTPDGLSVGPLPPRDSAAADCSKSVDGGSVWVDDAPDPWSACADDAEDPSPWDPEEIRQIHHLDRSQPSYATLAWILIMMGGAILHHVLRYSHGGPAIKR